jgi:hypothetical protein
VIMYNFYGVIGVTSHGDLVTMYDFCGVKVIGITSHGELVLMLSSIFCMYI